MSDRISIIRWRDPKTDPPKGDGVILAMLDNPDETTAQPVYAFTVRDEPTGIIAWAELPVAGEATLLDLGDACNYLDAYAENRHAHGLMDTADEIAGIARRLRALLGGDS